MSNPQILKEESDCLSIHFNQFQEKFDKDQNMEKILRQQSLREQSDQKSKFCKSKLKRKIVKQEYQSYKQLHETKTRINSLTLDEKKAYWLGLMNLIMQNPYIMYTWEQWRNQCYEKIEKYIKKHVENSKIKRTQIKSLDQNMKKRYYVKHKIDIEEAIIKALNNHKLNHYEQRELQEYEVFLKSRQQLFQEVILYTDKCIQQNKQQLENMKSIQNCYHHLLKKNDLFN